MNQGHPSRCQNHPGCQPPKKWPCFVGCFAAAPTSTPSAGKVKQAANLVTHQPAAMSGGPVFAKNRASNVGNAITVCCSPCRTLLSTSISLANAPLVSIRCWLTIPAIFLPLISMRRIGARMPRRFTSRVANWVCQPHWKYHARATVRTPGYSSQAAYRLGMRADSARPSSATPVLALANSSSNPTTACSPIRMPCPRAVSAISLRCHYRSIRVRTDAVCSWMLNCGLTGINGPFCLPLCRCLHTISSPPC